MGFSVMGIQGSRNYKLWGYRGYGVYCHWIIRPRGYRGYMVISHDRAGPPSPPIGGTEMRGLTVTLFIKFAVMGLSDLSGYAELAGGLNGLW
jgi:hypothetical protein